MKESLTLFEYGTNEESLKPNELLELEKLNNLYKDDLFKFRSNFRIEARQYVGIVQIKKRTIQVLPKIFSDNLEDKSFIISNLLYMLNYTKKLQIKETEIANLSKYENLFEIIIYLFATNLLKLLKEDFVRSYNEKEDNLNYLKGKIKINSHIKKNIVNKTKLYCSYDEFDENILLNQVLKKAVLKVINFTSSTKNFQLLQNCSLIFSDVEEINITQHMCNTVIFNRLNMKYEKVFNLAKLLLFGNSTILDSKNLESFSLMFDMNKLFEEFVGEFLKREFTELNIKTQKSDKYVFQENQVNFTKFQLKPDIFVNVDNDKILIIDTKYKKLYKSKSNYGVSQSDIYQMFMYGMRYFPDENSLNYTLNKKIILLYPKYDFDFKENNNLMSVENIEIFVNTVDLHKNLLKEEDRINLKKELETLFV